MNRILRRTAWLSVSAMLLCACPVPAQKDSPSKIKAAAIQVEMIQSDEITLPAEFQMALYENLVRQLERQKGSLRIYRAGDGSAANVANLVVLHSTVRGFKAGSERARQVTTFAGATSIAIHCQFTTPNGELLLERDVSGKVRFFGGNLRATHDFAKRAARMTYQNLSMPSGSEGPGT